MGDAKVAIELSRAEALVLLDWLARFSKKERVDFEDQAEQRVLWDLEAALERQVVEILDPEYADQLAAARAEVRDSTDRATGSRSARRAAQFELALPTPRRMESEI